MTLNDLSSEQQEFVHLALSGKNVLCDACIGSGKTSTINVLCDAYPPERRILYLTYNRLLKLDAKDKIKNGNVLVQNYHGFASLLLNKRGIRNCGQGEQLAMVLEKKVPIPPIDTLIIDEYQDINDEIAELLKYIRSQNPGLQIVAVGDMKQKIYDDTALDVWEFMQDFLGRHEQVVFTKCFRISHDLAERLGNIWGKTINGVNGSCIVEQMSVDEVTEFLNKQNPKDVLCLGARIGAMTKVLNDLENRPGNLYDKHHVYASIADNDGDKAVAPSSGVGIFTTFDGSKGMERPICVVFDFTEEYWSSRTSKPMSRYEILRNLFCVAASRGKQRIIFVNYDHPLSDKSLMTPTGMNCVFRHPFSFSEMFDHKFIEDVDACYKLLEVTPIEHNDNTTIDVQAADAMIDLSPCISIYMQAGFFNSYDIDDALAYYMDLHDDMQYLKIKKGATVEDKVLLLTALETNQCRYVKQVKPPFVNAKAKMSLSMRLGTVFTPDEYVQARGDIDIHTNDHKVIYTSGLADAVKNNTVYCIKFISSLAHKHFLQCACSMIALGLPYGVVWNVKSNLMYSVKIKDKDALIDAILKCITKRAYNGADYYTCRKGFVQDTASIIDRWTDDGYAEEPTAITSGDGIAIIKQGTRYFVMDGARRNTLNDNFGLGFADVKDACLAYAKSCELQKTVDHDSPYSEVEFWLDQNKAFEEYMTQVSHEIEQHEEGPYAKYKSFATPAVRKMLAEKGLTITFPEKVLIKVWKMRRAEDAMYQKIEEAKKQNSPNVPLDEAFFDSELVDSVEGSIESAKAKSKPKKESALPFSKYGADEKKSYRVVKSDELSKPNQPRYVVVEAATDKVLDNANGYGYLSYQAAWKGYSYKSKHHLDGTKKPISKSAKEQAKKKAAFFSTDSEQLSFG